MQTPARLHPAEAESFFRARLSAEPASPGNKFQLAVALLAQGKWAEGWPLYEARCDVPELNQPKPPLPFPEWRGQRLSGARILIWPEQGHGDQIMFARYAPWMRDQGADVTLVCRPRLAALFAASFEGVRVVAATGAAEFPTPDYWVLMGSIIHRLGHGRQDVPNAPYLTAPPVGSRGGIGLKTRGNPDHTHDAFRSLDAASAKLLCGLPGAVSLEPEDTGHRDFHQTASLIASLDEVVSVDTSVAHLAGAMGLPVTTLISHLGADWRWLHAAVGLPWYPSMKLLRQRAGEAWPETVRRLDVVKRAA